MKYIILFLILIILVYTLQKNKELFLNPEEGTLKKTPYKYGSRNIVDSIDEGVLFNLRPEDNINTYSEDLNFNQMNRILEELLFYNNHFIKFENVKDVDLKKMSEKIVKLINLHFKKFDLNHQHHKDDTREYIFLDYEILNDVNYPKFDKLNKRVTMNIEFYKELKDYSFVIQFDITYNIIKNFIEINQAKIIGFKTNEKRIFDNLNWNQTYCNLEDYEKYKQNPKLYKTKLQQCHKEQLLTKDETAIYFKKLMKDKTIGLSKKELNFFKEKKEAKKRDTEYKKNRCFDKKGFNESTCSSYSPEQKLVGTWDKPCNTNEECPFYKKNKNYENSRGGCLGGYCEMPSNILRLGYKKYNKNIKPFCHNCNIKDCLGEDCVTCCKEQSNREKYPDLNSPDYIFKNDQSQRNF